jgi:hypothetical protein
VKPTVWKEINTGYGAMKDVFGAAETVYHGAKDPACGASSINQAAGFTGKNTTGNPTAAEDCKIRE